MLMLNKSLTAEQRLTKAVVAIMGNPKYVALAGVLMIGNREVADDIPTACTNGRDEKYGRKFIESLNDAELRFLVLHECYHKLYKHLTTWRDLYEKNPRKANMACDYVINIKISDDNPDGFAKMPMKDGKPTGLIDEKYRGLNSIEVFRLLNDKDDDDDEDGDGDGSGGDGDNSGNGDGGNTGTGFDDHDWDGAKQLSDDEKQALARDIDNAVRQGALLAGKVGSGGNRDIDELLKAQIDWREALREFVQSTCAGSDYATWRKPNRRYLSSGYYLPSSVSEQVGELVIAIDMSASIGSREVSQFLGEVKAICDTVHPEQVRLLYWDTEVCADEVYDRGQLESLVTSTKPAGGGGTIVTCVPAYMATKSIKPQAVVVLTDGYLGSNWGNWNAPVLWCIMGNQSAVAPVGKTIHIND